MPAATTEDLRSARRILLHGVTGSGKSAAAHRLGELLELPVHLVDDEIGWLPGWVNRDPAEQRSLAAELAAAPSWVFDSSYQTFRDQVLPRAQVVVGLDYSRRLSFGRLLRRTARRWLTREPVCNGNVENLGQILSRDSILIWHFKSFGRKRAQLRAWEAAPDGVPVLRLRHPVDLERVLARLHARP
ncbi:adenylate kinase [Naumannella halotolerans]|uniref:adenylate kinase n=1 Tax=Naumannella halotolerans TaxID=993414 RepID=UPI00370DE27A